MDAALDRAEEAEEDLEDLEDTADAAERQTGQLQSQLSEAQQAELNARATAYIAAINGGGMARDDVTVTYERGSTLMINPDGSFDRGSGGPSISGFTARPYTRQVGVSGEETVYLYTNIQVPGTRAFWKVHGLEVTGAQDDEDQNPTPTAAPRTVMEDMVVTMTTVSGRYAGVSGTFTCDMDCTDDNVEFVQGESGARKFTAGAAAWDFEPSSITSNVQQMRDTEHLYFGIWVQEPNVASAAHDYEHITGGSPTFTGVGDLSGTAQFRGGAIGKYVTRNQVGENAKALGDL